MANIKYEVEIYDRDFDDIIGIVGIIYKEEIDWEPYGSTSVKRVSYSDPIEEVIEGDFDINDPYIRDQIDEFYNNNL